MSASCQRVSSPSFSSTHFYRPHSAFKDAFSVFHFIFRVLHPFFIHLLRHFFENSQSTSSSITTPAIISFSTQPLGPSAALSNRLLLCLLATRTALTAVATAAHRLMVKKDLLHKISAIFETHHVQKPSSSPSMFISASLIQRLEVVGAAFAQATPSAFASVQQTSESQSTLLASNITTDALDLSGSSNSAADEANTTSVGMR